MKERERDRKREKDLDRQAETEIQRDRLNRMTEIETDIFFLANAFWQNSSPRKKLINILPSIFFFPRLQMKVTSVYRSLDSHKLKKNSFNSKYRKTEIQKDRKTEREKYRNKKYRNTERQKDRNTERQKDRKTEIQNDRKTER
jgi:hypothetical protein